MSSVLFVAGSLLLGSMAYADSTLTEAAQGGDYPVYPKVNYGSGEQAERIKHGEYLVKAGDCLACHTDAKSGGKAFAGGLGIDTPFGTIYAPNITPDKETGIGKWTDEQFIRAMKEGIRADGKNLYPAFPYLFYSRLNKQDISDIHAYLKVVPAVHKQDKEPDMPWPFSWRIGVKFWNLMFFHTKEFKPDPSRPKAWNRGAYLVQTLGHCAMCHTPINFLGAPKWKYNLTGNLVDGYYAPNITSTHLKDTPIQDIVGVFLQDKLIGGGHVKGPMQDVNHNSLSHLRKGDLEAIAIYLKTVKSKVPPKPNVVKGGGKGAEIYVAHCAMCHASGANGSPKFGDRADWEPIIKQGLNITYKNAIIGIGGMPAKGACASCSDDDIQTAVRYMFDVAEHGLGGRPKGQKPPHYTMADGKKFYGRYCAVCHTKGWEHAPKLGDTAVWEPLLRYHDLDSLLVNAAKTHQLPGCKLCSDTAVIKAAIKYMAEQGNPNADYSLW